MKLCATILLFVLAMAVAPEILVEPVMIPMRDGVRPATDLYRPQGSDKLPVLLQRTPYGKSGVSLVEQAKRFRPAPARVSGYVGEAIRELGGSTYNAGGTTSEMIGAARRATAGDLSWRVPVSGRAAAILLSIEAYETA